ncbi:fatty acid desaturase [Pandoraea terrae]|uniref:Fatty acid desaturase n=1 Tax=Pandoraea terrae TaxID=1537710 RepID=A0A5E4SBH6_9BURK|nr:fatty acid desaturase [Pandoraea terrae]VVD73216.1 fatty acid desaturase [Pandoraea terrae]
MPHPAEPQCADLITELAPLSTGPTALATAHAPASLRRTQPLRLNRWLIGLVAAAGLWQWFGLPFMLDAFGGAAAWTLLPVLLLTPMHWGLIHESIHGQLRPAAKANEAAGRALSVLLALPYDIMRFGHLLHHRFTRQPFDRPDVLPADHRGSHAVAWLNYQMRLLGGMWVTELVAPLLAWVPVRHLPQLAERAMGRAPEDDAVRRRVVTFVGDPARRKRIRRDFAITLLCVALAVWAYGPWWPVFACSLAARGIWLSIADNLPHYGVALDEPARARNFRTSSVGRALLLNQNLHRVHHLYPTAPWHTLPAIAAAHPTPGPQIPYFQAAIRQFGGPVMAHRPPSRS